MPRANRLFGQHRVWHITQRCHNRQYLLKFSRDRSMWRHWLYLARRRYGLSVLNFIVTSNHIHLMVDSSDEHTVPKSMRLIASGTAQSYNNRKQRRGAFWDDRYHAVPIKNREHFMECLVYIDLNMVRAGVVSHPRDWLHCGYREIQRPKQRYVVIDYLRLIELAEAESLADFQDSHRQWIDAKLRSDCLVREGKWTSVATDAE